MTNPYNPYSKYISIRNKNHESCMSLAPVKCWLEPKYPGERCVTFRYASIEAAQAACDAKTPRQAETTMFWLGAEA